MQQVKEKSLLLKALGIERNRLRWYSALPSEMYTLIHFLSLKEGYCYANDEYLSKKLSVSVGAVRSALNKIKKEKWILIEPKYKTVTSYSKGKLVTKQVRCGRKIYPIFRIKTDINLNIDSKNVVEDINKKESENYAKELPKESRIISDKSLNVSQKNANVQYNSVERSTRLKTQQSHIGIDVEGEKKDRNLLTKLTNREREEYIYIATTTAIEKAKNKSIDTEEKSAQKKTEEKVVVENDFVFSKPVKEEKTVFVEDCNYTKYRFGLNAGLSKTTSTKIKQLEDEFLELGKLYYEGRKFTGPLRPLMARDYCKARERYVRLCLAGVTNKEATKLEIEKYLRWLAYDKTRTKQKIWSFMISPFRQWDDSREKAAMSTESSTGFDYSNEEFLKSIDPFENDVEEDMKKKSLPKKQLEEEFDKAWELYPRKKGKEKARKYFERDRNDGIDFEKILHGVKCYAAEVENDGIEEEFTKHGSTWFNGKYWADYEGLKLEDFSKQKSNGKKDTKPKVVEAPVSRDCTPEEIREEEESDYEYALRDKEFLGGQWPTSYLRFMPEWVREKEGISKEQLKEWIEHPRNHF